MTSDPRLPQAHSLSSALTSWELLVVGNHLLDLNYSLLLMLLSQFSISSSELRGIALGAQFAISSNELRGLA